MKENTYATPTIQYYKSKDEFDYGVAQDFIDAANKNAKSKKPFLVGLSHGMSPSGAYKYILEHYSEINKPELIRYTFVNSPLKRQQDLVDVVDATKFLHELQKRNLLAKRDVLGSIFNVTNKNEYADEFNAELGEYLFDHNKEGLDYIFIASTNKGEIAGISRKSDIFKSDNIVEVVESRGEPTITLTPSFIKKSKRLAFLATKAEKRRALAWLLHQNSKANESPSFLRFIEDVEKRLTIFIDDEALNWPQVIVERVTRFGPTTIKVDLPKPYNENAKKKLPVILMIHGFLGLNSFDGLLTHLPSHKYIAAAMHYGSVPDELEIERYSKHVVNNIDAVVNYFGEKGHDVFILDHSMGNVYFMMMDNEYHRLKGIQKYLKGRIGANPFFGSEAKHAVLGFLDNVIIPSLSMRKNPVEKTLFRTFRNLVPIDSKKGVRNRGIALTRMLINKDSNMRDRIWKAMKERIVYLMTNMDSLPHLNRVPIERALNRLPPKLFVIQIYSALLESKEFDNATSYSNFEKTNLPILILQSENDCIAKSVNRFHSTKNVEVIDVTNKDETDLFKEHLYHMVFLDETLSIIDDFITKYLT